MVGWLGTIPLAAHQVMITLSPALLSRAFGHGSSAGYPRESLYGTERLCCRTPQRLRWLPTKPAVLCFMGIPVFLLRHQIGGWFNDNAEVQAYVSVLIILMMVYQFGDGLQYTFANALRGIACVKPMVLYAFIAYFVISLPLGYTLGFTCGMGLLGIWIAFPFGLTIAGEMYRRRFEKELKKIEQR